MSQLNLPIHLTNSCCRTSAVQPNCHSNSSSRLKSGISDTNPVSSRVCCKLQTGLLSTGGMVTYPPLGGWKGIMYSRSESESFLGEASIIASTVRKQYITNTMAGSMKTAMSCSHDVHTLEAWKTLIYFWQLYAANHTKSPSIALFLFTTLNMYCSQLIAYNSNHVSTTVAGYVCVACTKSRTFNCSTSLGVSNAATSASTNREEE